eukprot:gene52905-61832_t
MPAVNFAALILVAAPAPAAARRADLAALGDDDLTVKELDDAFAATTELVTTRGGVMGNASSLGGLLQRAPGGEFSASLVAGALTRQTHAHLLLFAKTLVSAWRAAAAGGHLPLANTPPGAPFQAYRVVIGRGGIDPVTGGLTELAAPGDLGDVGAAVEKLCSYLSVGDDSPPGGEVVYILEVLQATGASGTVTFSPQDHPWSTGIRVGAPLDTTLHMTAKGSDGAFLPLRAFKPLRAAQIHQRAEGLRLTTSFDGLTVMAHRRQAADGLQVGFEQRALADVSRRATLAQELFTECAKAVNAKPPDASSIADALSDPGATFAEVGYTAERAFGRLRRHPERTFEEVAAYLREKVPEDGIRGIVRRTAQRGAARCLSFFLILRSAMRLGLPPDQLERALNSEELLTTTERLFLARRRPDWREYVRSLPTSDEYYDSLLRSMFPGQPGAFGKGKGKGAFGKGGKSLPPANLPSAGAAPMSQLAIMPPPLPHGPHFQNKCDGSGPWGKGGINKPVTQLQ